MGHVTLPTVVNGEFYPPSYVRMLRIFEFEAVAFQNADLRSTYILIVRISPCLVDYKMLNVTLNGLGQQCRHISSLKLNFKNVPGLQT